MKIISIPQLGHLLLKARKDKGFKQKEVLEYLEISRTSLYELENGLREHIDLATILKLIALYDMSLDVSLNQLKQKLKSRGQSAEKVKTGHVKYER